MSKRLAGLLGVVILVLIALLVACGSNYDSASNGLLLVGSQGSALVETFSFDLQSGHVSAISNTPDNTASEACVLPGLPSSIVMDPAGAYAFAILNSSDLCPGSKTGIMAFKVNSDGTTTQVGSLVPDPNPVMMIMDPNGKSLYVAEGTKGLVNAYAIGSGGTFTAVNGTYKFVNGLGFQTPNIAWVATSYTVFPKIGLNGVQNAVCSAPQNTPPKSEFLYAVDSLNNVAWEFGVDTSTGALTNPPGTAAVQVFSTDQVPMGVAVDPCDRFVYVSDSLTNKVSAYVLCAYVNLLTGCPYADGSLVQISGSPISLSGSANGPGPLTVDAYGNYLYVLGTLSNTISPLKISPISGGLTALTPPTVATGVGPISIVVRGDDSWLFVANFGSQTQGGNTVSQYSVTPETGVLLVAPAIPTDNYPWGLAVK